MKLDLINYKTKLKFIQPNNKFYIQNIQYSKEKIYNL